MFRVIPKFSARLITLLFFDPEESITRRSLVSKLLPLSENPIIQAIQNDWYYCFLAPLTLPALLVSVYFHWLTMKLFKHA
ncbi:hypothetical protein HA466_0194390 [Hirschfeldia incana]|nr:hypothetical protein HA466_0194390 [Hirschfeldia incana]